MSSSCAAPASLWVTKDERPLWESSSTGGSTPSQRILSVPETNTARCCRGDHEVPRHRGGRLRDLEVRVRIRLHRGPRDLRAHSVARTVGSVLQGADPPAV